MVLAVLDMYVLFFLLYRRACKATICTCTRPENFSRAFRQGQTDGSSAINRFQFPSALFVTGPPLPQIGGMVAPIPTVMTQQQTAGKIIHLGHGTQVNHKQTG